jgi:hypothetical protein
VSDDIPGLDDIKRFMWNRGDLSWKLWPQQVPIHDTIRNLPKHIQTAVVLCARQYGKSYLGTLMAVEDALQYPGFTIPIVGPTIKQTVDIVNQSMRLIQADAPPDLIRRSKSESRWYVGDSEIIVGGFDVRTATRQRGKRALKIYIEEVMDANPDDYLEALRSDLGPMLTHSPDPMMIFLTTPPRVPDHPFITDTIPEAKLYGAFFKHTIDENDQLSPDQYNACVRRCGGKDSIEFRREYLCEIVRDTSIVVVPSFERNLDVAEFDIPYDAKWQVVTDWGGVRDLTVALLMGYDYTSELDLVLDERMFPANTPTESIYKELLELERLHALPITGRYADVPGQVSVDLTLTHNYIMQPVKKDDWQSAINFVNVRFAQRKVKVHPRCKFLIQSLESGTFNKMRTDFERTSALGHCDAVAALMYGLRTQDKSNPFHDPELQRQMSNQVSWKRGDSGMVSISKSINPVAGKYQRKSFGRFG